MTKDSQPDNKKARMEKCNYQTPITEEGINHNPNGKHKSVKRQGVSSDNIIILLVINKKATHKLIVQSLLIIFYYSIYAFIKIYLPQW